MSLKYKFVDKHGIYFTTSSVVDWVDVFIRDIYREILLDSIRFCQLNQGLQLHAWVLMINHLHLLSRRGFRKDDLSLINASSAKPRRYTRSKTKIRNYDTLYNFYTALQQLVAVITMIPRRYFLSGRSPTVTKILKVRQ